ncbi:MAG: hypothetical protein PHF29_07480 [Candidatus Riflebacteria bacterium]|nr:hypothetical protein [Candidatus Riflebacteria bacterium]MDD3001579.1 hypothetical protein [Candidatus Riflebacteria bacterium]
MEEASITYLIAKYGIDIILVVAFLYILFFCKPNPNCAQENPAEEEQPNELEKLLVSDSENTSEDNPQDNSDDKTGL